MNSKSAIALAALVMLLGACQPGDDTSEDTRAQRTMPNEPDYATPRQPDSRLATAPPMRDEGAGQPGQTVQPERTETETVSFSGLDTNQDGKLDRDEAAGSAALDRSFTELDVNRDGTLSYEEFATQRMER